MRLPQAKLARFRLVKPQFGRESARPWRRSSRRVRSRADAASLLGTADSSCIALPAPEQSPGSASVGLDFKEVVVSTWGDPLLELFARLPDHLGRSYQGPDRRSSVSRPSSAVGPLSSILRRPSWVVGRSWVVVGRRLSPSAFASHRRSRRALCDRPTPGRATRRHPRYTDLACSSSPGPAPSLVGFM